jgi:hypothetical protein
VRTMSRPLALIVLTLALAAACGDNDPVAPSAAEAKAKPAVSASKSERPGGAGAAAAAVGEADARPGARSKAALQARQVSTLCRRYGLKLLRTRGELRALPAGAPEGARLQAKAASLEEMMTDACADIDPGLLDASPTQAKAAALADRRAKASQAPASGATARRAAVRGAPRVQRGTEER